MKKIAGLAAVAAIMTLSLTGCMGWSTTATVGGGSGWFAGDAPYYWSDWNTPPPPPVIGNGPGSILPTRPRPIPQPQPQPPVPTRPGAPGNNPGFNPGPGRPTPPPAQGNGPGSNPGSPSQGGFRGQK